MAADGPNRSPRVAVEDEAMTVRARKSVSIRRAYDPAATGEGFRVLVDRFWPRGCRREEMGIDAWERELAPTSDLIHWFGHDPGRWDAFRERYRKELSDPGQHARLEALLEAAGRKHITLVYGARSPTENQAVVLRDVLLEMRMH